MITMYHVDTDQPLWSSNSIQGIIDIVLMNWSRDPGFTVTYNDEDQHLSINGVEYYLKYVEIPHDRSDLD